MPPANGGTGARLFVGIGTKTVHDRWVRQQVEADLVFLFLGVASAGYGQYCQGRHQAANHAVSSPAAPELLAAIIVHCFLLMCPSDCAFAMSCKGAGSGVSPLRSRQERCRAAFGESNGSYLRYRNLVGKDDMQFGMFTLLHRDTDCCRMRDSSGLRSHHDRSGMVV